MYDTDCTLSGIPARPLRSERAGLWVKVKLLWVGQSLAASGENRLHNPEWRDVNDTLKRDLDFV